MKKKEQKTDIQVNVLDFDKLINISIKNSKKLMEYFRLQIIYYMLITGKGLEFDKLKTYSAGMDPRRMDWKIYARTGKLFVRSYKEERQLDVIIILDVSNSMLLGTAEFTKNEFASLIAGTIAYAATEAGDNIGGGPFSDRVEAMIDPDPEFYNFMHVLSKKENYGGNKNWSKLVTQMLSNYTQDSIVFVISDFINTNIHSFLPELSSHFAKVYGIMVRDPIDNKLPEGIGKMYLKDPDTNQVVLADIEDMRDEYEVANRKYIENTRDLFHQYGQLFFKLDTGEDFATGFIKAMGHEKVEIL